VIARISLELLGNFKKNAPDTIAKHRIDAIYKTTIDTLKNEIAGYQDANNPSQCRAYELVY